MLSRPTPLSVRGFDTVYRALGNTEDGRKWAMAALHPCDEAGSVPNGIPDQTMETIVTPALRNTSNIVYPGAAVTGTWNLQIIVPPIPEIDYLWRYQDTTAPGVWGSWRSVRPASFPGFADGTATTLGVAGYEKYRMQARGLTFHHIASSTTNQGSLVAGQLNLLQNDEYQPISGDGTNAPVSGVNLARQTVISAPYSSQQLAQQDSLYTEWEARHGAYMPIRFRDPTNLFKRAASGLITAYTDGTTPTVYPDSSLSIVSSVDGGITGVNTIINSPVATYVPLPGVPTQLQNVYGASEPFNMLTGVLFFEGLDRSATVRVKSKTYLECTAALEGLAIQPFVHGSPCLDRQAIDTVALIGQVQAHAYYASYNDLSSILKSIWGALETVGKPLLGFARDSGIPVVSDVGKIGGRIFDAIDRF